MTNVRVAFALGVVFWPIIHISTAAAQDPKLPPPPSGKQWKLVWGDEFNGTKLDLTKWTIRTMKVGRNKTWTPKAISLDGKGHLVIRTYRENGQVRNGAIWTNADNGDETKAKFRRKFGYYVARVQFHKQPGHWPAFWLYSGAAWHKKYVGWKEGGKDGTEIDIMEKPWLDNRVNHALHWDGYGKGHQHVARQVTVDGIMKGWHTFAVHWTKDKYVFYIDGNQTWETSAGGVCQVPLLIQISDETGLSWAGDINKAKLPDYFLVDYVRVYDLEPIPPDPQKPYKGIAWKIPGRIQAEDFDIGGEGVAFHDVDKENQGQNNYRGNLPVDLENSLDDDGTPNVGYTSDNEWLEYTVDASYEGWFEPQLRFASKKVGGAEVGLEVDGKRVWTIPIGNTDGWQSYQTLAAPLVYLKKGKHVIRLVFVKGGVNLNWIEFLPKYQQQPFKFVRQLPGMIEAEDFDEGPGGSFEIDTRRPSQGFFYRPNTGVDLQYCMDVKRGVNIGYAMDGEWVEYTVNIKADQEYTPVFRVASQTGGADLRVQVDGKPIIWSIPVKATGGWQKYETLKAPPVKLPKGEHVIRITFVKGGVNFNWFGFWK
ncbi:MAG: hypothetical protein KatS3mg105_3384 [Gemmatales bacterium]|nr:MAG: hypothetical protein KatS3mg105_3384 [Gemmatales bacterium]